MFEEFYEMYEPEEQEVVALINRDNSGQISVPQTAAKVPCFYRSQRKNQSGNHAATVVHPTGEGIPQSNGGIRRMIYV